MARVSSATIQYARQATTKSLEIWYSNLPPPMKAIPLFGTFEHFTTSLPKIRERDMYVRDKDLDVLADALEWNPDGCKFMVGPSGSGKTSFGLRGFLESALREKTLGDPFRYYIYLAFAGNCGRHYQPSHRSPSTNPRTAHNQGAAFMLECITAVLNKPWEEDIPRVIPLNEKPLNIAHTREALRAIFAKFDDRVLVHLDEPGKMCEANLKVTEAFTTGAMGALAHIYGVTVLVTDTSVPLLPTGFSSSLFSRDPVSIPSLDVDAAIADIPAFSSLQGRVDAAAKASKLDGNQERLWDILRFRLALQLRTMSHSKAELDSQFKAASEAPNLTQALVECCELCDFQLATPSQNKNALKLLCGVSDESNPQFHLEVPNDQLVVDNGRVTCKFTSLLEMSFPDEGRVFDKGRELMANTVSHDFLTAQRPLKAAYFWALSTRALHLERLDFVEQIHGFLCRQLKPGRIFPSHQAQGHSLDWISQIEPRTFYYADEGKDPHPLIDCWFLNEVGDVVLCAIASGQCDPEEKAAKLDEWIKTEQAKIAEGPVLCGAVLAPHAEGESESFTDWESCEVGIVRGIDAIRLLGGLSQVFRWV